MIVWNEKETPKPSWCHRTQASNSGDEWHGRALSWRPEWMAVVGWRMGGQTANPEVIQMVVAPCWRARGKQKRRDDDERR